MEGFKLGKIVVTKNLSDEMVKSSACADFVKISLGRYANKDWGDTDEGDKKANEEAIKNGGRIFAMYKHKKKTIWISTDPDTGTTTIMLPEDY